MITDFEEELIEHMRKNPSMWDKNQTDYKKQQHRTHFWNDLAAQLGVSDKKVKTRWKSLRDAYRTETIKLRNYKAKGIDITEKDVKWKYFHDMSYLKPIFATSSDHDYDNNENDTMPTIETFYTDETEFEKYEMENNLNSNYVMDEHDDSNSFTQIEFDNYDVLNMEVPSPAQSITEESLEPSPSKILAISSKRKLENSPPQNVPVKMNKNHEIAPESDISLFFRTMSLKVENAQLSEEELENLQVEILFAITRKLRDIKQARNEVI